jgi:hypothetical protein
MKIADIPAYETPTSAIIKATILIDFGFEAFLRILAIELHESLLPLAP